MNWKSFFVLLFSFSCLYLLGQDSVLNQDLALKSNTGQSPSSTWLKLGSNERMLHSFSIKTTSDFYWPYLEYREGKKKPWKPLIKNSHQQESEDFIISELIFIDADSLQLRNSYECTLELQLFSIEKNSNRKELDEYQFCQCDSVQIRTRDQWCPDGDCPLDPTPVSNKAEFIIIHHTAGGNDAPDYDAVVRSYYRFHVETRGWDDIGYNYLISPEGVIYEGRGSELLGAHFCAQNTGTLGVGLIGDYSSVIPSTEILESAIDLSAYMSCLLNIEIPSMSFHSSSQMVLDHLSGHRDGCNTACPGDMLYSRLPDLRNEIVQLQDDSCFIEPIVLEIMQVDGQFTLEWSHNVTEEVAYKILFAQNIDDEFNAIDSVPVGVKQYFFDPEAMPGWYQIQVASESSTHQCSNIVNIEVTSIVEWEILEDSKETFVLYNVWGQVVREGNAFEIRSSMESLSIGNYWLVQGEKVIRITR